MPDCHQSTLSTPSTPTTLRRAEAPATRGPGPGSVPIVRTPTTRRPVNLAGPAIRPRFSIRLAERGGAECDICGEPTGTGPIGCCEDEPICDRCLIEGCHELGMVLALVAVVRSTARLEPPTEEQARQVLEQLGGFIKVYEQVAARFGPPRPFIIPGSTDTTH